MTAISMHSKRMDLFVVDNDGLVRHNWWEDGVTAWQDDWEVFIGLKTAPKAVVAAVARTDHNLDVFITGGDGHVYWTSWGVASAVIGKPAKSPLGKTPYKLERFPDGSILPERMPGWTQERGPLAFGSHRGPGRVHGRAGLGRQLHES